MLYLRAALLVVVLLAVPSTAAASYVSTVTADSPAAYWRLGEASGTNANDEITTNDGTYSGVTLGAAGALTGDSDTAVTLNGTSSAISVPSGVGAFSGGPVTAEAWVKTSDTSTLSQMIFGAYQSTSPYPGWGFLYNQGSADHKLAFFTPSGGWVKSTGTITDTAWHYVAAKITTGGSVTFYIDGSPAGTASSTAPNSYTGAKGIGVQAGGGGARFKGDMDEVAVYGAALSDAQVAAHYAAGTTGAAHYYVSPTGSDSNNGTSTSTPWQTIGKVNSHTFVAGDEVSFQGGQSFSGLIAPSSGGTTANPIVFDSYGAGRASILGTNAGFFVGAFGGVTIQDLNFPGPGVGTAGLSDGIVLFQGTGTQVTAAVKILRVDISGWKGGIGVGGTTKGYAHITVDEADLHGNRDYGFVSYGPTFTGSNYANADITIRRSNAYSNLGNPLNTTTHTGDGIAVGSTDGALIERSSAHDNGSNNTASEGPVGLWTYDSNAVTIRRSISYSNRTSGANDGGGFDLDQNVTGALLQDDLAWGNDGSGFLVSGGGAGASSNTIDGVSSVGNNLDGNAGAELLLFATASTLEIEDSTFLAQSATRDLGLGTVGGATLTGVTVHDNMLADSGTGALVDANSSYSTSAVLFSANGYHRVSGFLVKWPTATAYTSKAAWNAATGQEP